MDGRHEKTRVKDDRPVQTASLRSILPEVWELVKPRRWTLALGLALIGISRAAGLVLPASTKYILDDVIGKRDVKMLAPLVVAVLVATAVQASTSYALTQLLSISAQRLIAELRRKVQAHVGRLPVAYYDANKTGVLVARIMSDVEGVRNLVGTGLVEFVGGVVTAALALVVLLRINATLTAVSLALVGIFMIFLRRGFKVIRPIFRERGKINAEVTGRLTETLGGVRVVKGYHAEEREADVFASGVTRLLNNVIRSLTALSVMGFSATLLLGAVGSLVMYVGARSVLAGGPHGMTVGSLVTFTMFLAFLVAPAIQVVSIGTQLTEAAAGLDRTREVLGERPEDEDPGRVSEIGEIRGEVRFEDVSFAYEEGKPVIHDISFDSSPGTVTALVGSSGSGKSTIIGLIAAFYKPGSGRVLVDDADLATVKLASYRSQLGVVFQDTFLFDGSIRDNVAFGRPAAAEEDLLQACRIARVDEFAEQFENKYDSVIGERGVKLSGGQRQRVSIARAILANPRILILDEATSSLDSESEASIQQGLAYLMQGRTTFVIAHRLSTIRRADQILVVEGGRIVERGTHETLYAAGGRYYELYTRQHGIESNLFLAPGEGDKPEMAEGGEEPAAPSQNGSPSLQNPLGVLEE
ncbi:MAG: ABC transporter ATP-binding protein [Bryobacteraceae bacterium]